MTERTPGDLQRSLWRLDRNLKILRNQTDVLSALQLAMQAGYASSDWYEEADALSRRVAAEVFRTCEQIALDSDLIAREEGVR